MKELTIEVNANCSLNCVHCSHDSSEEEIDYPGYEVWEVFRDIDAFPEFGKIRISGGEPFENSELLVILKGLKSRGKVVELLSSGVCHDGPVPEEVLGQCKGLVDNIRFSLYGSREMHERVTRTKGSFDWLNQTIKRTIQNRISFSFGYVLMKDYFEGFRQVIELVSYYKRFVDGYCDSHLGVFSLVNQGHGRKIEGITIGQASELKHMAEVCRSKYDVQVDKSCSFLGERCTAGISKAAILSKGEIIPCSALKEKGIRYRKIEGGRRYNPYCLCRKA